MLEITKSKFWCIQITEPPQKPKDSWTFFPQDLGLEITEDELAHELAAPVPGPFSGQIGTDGGAIGETQACTPLTTGFWHKESCHG